MHNDATTREKTIIRQRRLNIQRGNKKKCVTFIWTGVVVDSDGSLDAGPLARRHHGVRGWRMFVLLLFDTGSEETVSDPSAWIVWPGEYPTQLILCRNSGMVWLLAGVFIILHLLFVRLNSRSAQVSVIVTGYGNEIVGVKFLSADKNNVFLKASSSNDSDAVNFPLWFRRKLFSPQETNSLLKSFVAAGSCEDRDYVLITEGGRRGLMTNSWQLVQVH